jgi:hypothetical protein
MGMNLGSQTQKLETAFPNSVAAQMHVPTMPNNIASLMLLMPMPGNAAAPAPGGVSQGSQTIRPNGAVATAANAAGKGGAPAPSGAAGAQQISMFAPAQSGQKSLLGQ